jgi:glycerol-3-phosphate dehydrogenase
VLDTLRSAAKAGAKLRNYCRFINAQRAGNDASAPWQCEMEDRRTNTKVKASARAVVNATGPWADGLPHSRVKLRLTKGIHLVVERDRVPVPDTVVMTEGKRILFVIPWGQRTVIGTTDTDYHDSLDHVTANAADLSYVLQITNQFFPAARLTHADVISVWAGLRPLIADPNGKPSDISRSHQIRNPEPGWWDVAGGKLTTYRLMAEQTVDRIVAELKLDAAPCRTAKEPLLPASEVAGLSGILPPEFNRRSVEHYCTAEWARHLDDVMVRRTSWHYYYRDARAKAERVADWMGELLGWSAEQRTGELQRYHDLMDCPSLKPVAAETRSAPVATR